MACGGSVDTDGPDSNAPDTNTPETDAVKCNGDDIHDVEVEEILATCQARGYRRETCKTCGEVVSESAYPKTACTPAAPATCTVDSVCSVCGEVLNAAKGHTLGEAVVVDATCVAEGSKTQECSVCGDTVVETIPMVAHNIPDANVTGSTAATCSTAGTKTGTCSTCNQEQTVDLPKLSHQFKAGEFTVTADGTISGTCTVCSETVAVEKEVRVQLDFEATNIAEEVANHENSETYGLKLTTQKGEEFQAKASPYRTTGDRTVMETTAAMFLEFNSSVLADSSYYIISFDLALNNLERLYDIKPSMMTVVAGKTWTFYPLIKYETNMRKLAGIKNNADAVTDENSIDVTQGTWYQCTIITDSNKGSSSIYVNGQLLSVLNGCKATEANFASYSDRFGVRFPEANGNKPYIDNFKISVVK